MNRQHFRRRGHGWWVSTAVLAAFVPLLSFGEGPATRLSNASLTASPFGAANATLGNSLTAGATSATSTGDLLVAAVRTRTTTTGVLATVSSVTDTASNTWQKAVSISSGTQADEEIWYASNAASIASGGSVTVSVSNPAAIAFTVLDVSGGSSSLDVTAASKGNSTVASAGPTPTLAAANEMAVADIGWNGAVTVSGQTAGYGTYPNAPWSEQSTVSGGKAGEQVAWEVSTSTTPVSYGATLSSSVTWTDAIATFVIGTPSSGSPTPTPTPSSSTVPHIMMIMEENQGYGNIIGSSNAPYLNSLAAQYASATNWYAVEHTSQNDYVEVMSGLDLLPAKAQNLTESTLVDELFNGGTNSIPWSAYMESMPSTCWTGKKTTDGLYDYAHNPFFYFKDYAGYCAHIPLEGVVPYPGSSNFSQVLDGPNAPDFVLLVPNNCDDMHGDAFTGSPCSGIGLRGLISNGDTWLQNNLAPVLRSTWFADNGIVIISWDEAHATDASGWEDGAPCASSSCGCPPRSSSWPGCGGHIPTLVISSANANATSHSFTTGGNLLGTLRGIEEAYGVADLGDSNGSASIGSPTTSCTASPSTCNGDLTPMLSGDLTGTVSDAASGDPIAGASVSATCATGSSTTDASGQYSLSGVANDLQVGPDCSLTVDAVGYSQTTQSGVTISNGSVTTVDVTMSAS
jgi:hypothetical protein